MSDESPISPQLRAFVEELGSIEAIETLLALAQTPSRAYSAHEVARTLHVTKDMEPVLEQLARLNLLDVRLRSRVSYAYAPGSPTLDGIVRELASEYTARRLAVLEILSTRSPMQAFADAFRLRRKRGRDG